MNIEHCAKIKRSIKSTWRERWCDRIFHSTCRILSFFNIQIKVICEFYKKLHIIESNIRPNVVAIKAQIQNLAVAKYSGDVHFGYFAQN